MDFPGRLIAAFLAVVLILFFPLQYLAKTTESNMDSYIEDCTEQFSDDIRNKGYLDAVAYEAYVQTLDASGELYDVEIEDIHPVTGEEVSNYEDKKDMVLSTNKKESLLQIEGDKKVLSFTQNSIMKSGVTQSKFTPMNSLDKRIQKEQYSKDEDVIQSFTTHTHTAECYAGHRHSNICYDNLSHIFNSHPMTYYIGHDTRYRFEIEDFNYPGNSWGTFIHIICADCGKHMGRLTYYTFPDGRRNVQLEQWLYETYYETYTNCNPVSNETPNHTAYNAAKSNFDSICASINNGESSEIIKEKLRYAHFINNAVCYKCRGNASDISWINYTPYDNLFVCDKSVQDETPICNQVVTSITPTNPVQTVKKGENIITMATATYLDGHTGIVNCTSNFNPNIGGTQTVTLIYNGLVGNAKTTGTRTCTMSVTVNLKTLDHINVTPQTQTISRMGSPSFTITAYYNDGTSAVIPSGSYTMSAFDNTTPGAKKVTISYTDGGITKTTTATVNVDEITSLAITPNDIAVDKYTEVEALPITVTANYYYGSKKVITSGYVISGYDASVIGDQTITVTYTESGKTVSTSILVHVTAVHMQCPVCGKVYEVNPDDTDPGCPFCKDVITGIEVSPVELEVARGSELPISVMATYKDGSVRAISGWSSSFIPDQLGFQLVTIQYGGFETSLNVMVKETEATCPSCGKSYPISEGSCPVCREKVVSISVNKDALTVDQYGTIELEVIATYADGSTRPVTDWSIDCTTANPGVYSATVIYKNKSASLTLTVLSQSMISCPYCKMPYDRGEHPEGCPDCFKTITGIEAFSASGSDMVQLGTLPDISVVLIFKDTHREIAKDGYTIEGFQANQLGAQTVTVKYKKFSCTLTIRVVNAANGIVCPKGHIYYPDEDGKDTGCPFCVIEEEHPTIVYYDITYLSQILDVVYTDGIYRFDSGNYLTVRATKRDLSLVSKIQKLFFKLTLLGRKRRFTYGGEVL